jgi:hypothetical protein
LLDAHQTSSNLIKPHQTSSNLIKPHQTSSNRIKPHQTASNLCEQKLAKRNGKKQRRQSNHMASGQALAAPKRKPTIRLRITPAVKRKIALTMPISLAPTTTPSMSIPWVPTPAVSMQDAGPRTKAQIMADIDAFYQVLERNPNSKACHFATSLGVTKSTFSGQFNSTQFNSRLKAIKLAAYKRTVDLTDNAAIGSINAITGSINAFDLVDKHVSETAIGSINAIAEQAIIEAANKQSAKAIKAPPVAAAPLLPLPVKLEKGVWTPKEKPPQGMFTYSVCGHKEFWPCVKYMLDNFMDDQLSVEHFVYTCPSCQAAKDQPLKQYRADFALCQTIKAKTKQLTSELFWPNAKQSVLLEEQFELHLAEEILDFLASVEQWNMFAGEDIQFKRLTLEATTETLRERNMVQGAFLPEGMSLPETRTLARPSDGAYGVCDWAIECRGRGKPASDYIIFAPPFLSDSNLVLLGKSETINIAKGEKGTRHGAAGGFTQAGKEPSVNDPKSLSEATRGKYGRAIIAPKYQSKSTRVKVLYPNTDGKPTTWGSIYADVYMGRYNKNKKRTAAAADPVFRRVLIGEMKSRLRAFAIIVELELDTFDSVFGSFIKAIGRLQKGKCKEKWHRIDVSLSVFDMLLLEYACGTGEMRNHQALATHPDENKSHHQETMNLIGRVEESDTRTHDEIAKKMREERAGSLVLPHKGMCAHLEPGCPVHLQLASTMHAPDRSRDSLNWTRVHGP